MTRISIVTATFQAAPHLPRTLHSVATQTSLPFEHVIVDGGSTDDTLTIARRYAADAPYTVTIVSEPDRGIYDAMNKGIRMATGDYLLFLNAGDALHATDTLQTVASHAQPQPDTNGATAEATRPAVVYGDTAITDTEGRFLHMRHLRPPERLTWKSFRQGMLVCHQAFYVRTDIARNTGYDLGYRHSADVDWCIRVMKEAERRALPLVNTHTVVADFAEGGNTTKHHRDSLCERFDVMRRHYGLTTTLAMHAWFVLRAIGHKLAPRR